jgi:hypothetical protein
MKKSLYKKYLICLVIAFLTLPSLNIWAVRYFSLSDAETFALSFPTILLMFFGLVFAGVLSENLKD